MAVKDNNIFIVRQVLHVQIDLAKGISDREWGREMANLHTFHSWLEEDVPKIIAPIRFTKFQNETSAENAMESLVRPKFNDKYSRLKMEEDGALGTNIEHN